MKKNLKRILAAVAFALLIAVLALVYIRFSEKPVAGSKSITITVVDSAAKETAYTLRTDAEYLDQAMKEAEGLTFSAYEGPYGMVITAVNGETADFNVDSAYWSVSVNGEYGNYGISQQPVRDGDAFTIAYTR